MRPESSFCGPVSSSEGWRVQWETSVPPVRVRSPVAWIAFVEETVITDRISSIMQPKLSMAVRHPTPSRLRFTPFRCARTVSQPHLCVVSGVAI